MTTSQRSTWPALALLLATAGLVPSAAAAPAPSDQAYRDAVKAETSGDVVGALAKFEAIPPANRDVLVRLHIASCERKLARFLAAAKHLESLLADPGLDDATRETAQSDLDDLRAHTPKLYVRLSVATADVRATLDGEPLAPPVTKLLDPGAHVVAATRDGREVFRREIVLAEGMSLDVEIDAPQARTRESPATVGEPAPGAAPTPRAPPTSTRSSVIDRGGGVTSATGWVLIGFGGLSSAGALVARYTANSAYRDWQASCRAGPCDDAARDRTRRWDALTVTGIGVAVVGVGIGVTLVLTSSADASPVTVRAVAGGVNGIEIAGRF